MDNFNAQGLVDERIKVGGKVFRIRENAWGNVYGYEGNRKVENFWGSTDVQIEAARRWLAIIQERVVVAQQPGIGRVRQWGVYRGTDLIEGGFFVKEAAELAALQIARGTR